SHLVVLRISWGGMSMGKGTGCQVAPLVGHTDALPDTDAAVCDTPLAQLRGTTWGFLLSEPPSGARLAMAAGAAPGEAAEGCVLVVVGHGTPPPVFLGRCGVLLTVNEAARTPEDGLPAANGAEQQLACDLMSQLQL